MNKRHFQIFNFCLLLLALPLSAARYALLVGCNNGGANVETLKFAEADAERFAGLITRLGGFDGPNVMVLHHPDSMAIEEHLRKIKKVVELSRTPESDLFLFYFSGHADGSDILLGQSKYPLRKVESFIDSLHTGVRIGIFDACQSGAVTAYKGGRRAEPFYLKNPQKIKGEVIIASATANERAQESESLKGSVFSFYWLSGLRGSADASGDRRVTLTEAYNYAYRKTVETSTLTGGEAQHPMYRFNIAGEGDITLTDLANRSGGIIFDRSCEGKFLVLSDSYTDIFADFFKKSNSEWYVSLDPGRYMVVNANRGVIGMYDCTIGQYSQLQLQQSMLSPNELTETRIKGVNVVAQTKMSVPDTRPLSACSWGFGIGVLSPVRNDARKTVTVNMANKIYIREGTDLFFNLYYLVSGMDAGADIGFDLGRKASMFGLLAGGGVGLYYLRENGSSINEAFSPAATAHIGFAAETGKRSTIIAQVPYTVIFGPVTSHRFGFEVKLLFSGPYKDIKVLKY